MPFKILSLLLAAGIGLSGCALTSELWHGGFTRYNEDRFQDEQIYAFGFTKPTSQNLTPNRLVMMGDQAVYVTEVTPEHDLVKALRTTDLSKPFGFDGDYGLYVKFDNGRDGSFVAASGKDSQNKPSLCLSYGFDQNTNAATRTRETAKLVHLGFERQGENGYKRCYGLIRGSRYAMSESLPAEYRFQTPVTITLQRGNATELDGGRVAKAIILTPITLIGDIIMLPIMPFVYPAGSRI